MFGDIAGDEGSKLLVDFVVLIVFVHSADVIEDVFVYHGAEFFIFDAHLSEEEFDGADWDEDALGTEDHYAAYAFFAEIGVEGGTEFLHQFHDGFGDPAEDFRKMFDGPGEEDEQLSKSLVFLHGVALNFIEFNFEKLVVMFNI